MMSTNGPHRTANIGGVWDGHGQALPVPSDTVRYGMRNCAQHVGAWGQEAIEEAGKAVGRRKGQGGKCGARVVANFCTGVDLTSGLEGGDSCGVCGVGVVTRWLPGTAQV